MTYSTQPTRGYNNTRKAFKPSFKKQFTFNRHSLPSPYLYYVTMQKMTFKGRESATNWVSAVCPFHDDTSPSLRVHMSSGAFSCMACGAKGGDVLAFHMKKYNMPFLTAVKDLGCGGSDHE